MTLAELKGSEKQVNWANDIRQVWKSELESRIKDNQDLIDQRLKEGGRTSVPETKIKYLNELIGKLSAVDDSKFFIDNRSKGWSTLKNLK